jgi:nucleotide-binding universal stress UspA family protein
LQSKAELEHAEDAWRQEMQAYLNHVATPLREAGIEVDCHMTLGDPAELINAAVAEENIGLIIMSTHGRTGVPRWVYGSVAHKVLRLAECPLILVRPKMKESQAKAQQVTAPQVKELQP